MQVFIGIYMLALYKKGKLQEETEQWMNHRISM